MIQLRSIGPLLVAVTVLLLSDIHCSLAASLWTERVVPGPSPRGEFGFAYDSNQGVAVLFGGASSLNFAAVNRETWTWSGFAWTLADSTGPSARCDNAMAYDSVRDRVVSFAGFNGTYLGDTWVRSAGAWSQITGAMPPGPRADSFMAFDSQRGVMVLFGGQTSNGLIRSDTWEFGEATWTQRAASGPPPARWIQRMAYDAKRAVTVMFGGAAPDSLLADTWEWNGLTWTANPASGPSARYGHAMAYDSLNGVTVLFGGQSELPFGEGVLGDTWTYDGTEWMELPISGPSPRSFVKMVYDSARERIVVFGGWDGTQMVDDTWELAIDAATGVDQQEGTAARWVVAPSAPNPFEAFTEIRYSLPEAQHVKISIHDSAGALVRRLLDQTQSAGPHSITWNRLDDSGRAAASGTYFYRLQAGNRTASGRMVLVR